MREGSIAHRYSCLIIVNFTLDNSSVQLWSTQGFTLSYEERLQFSGCHSRLWQIRPMDPSFGSLHSLSHFLPIVSSVGSALRPLWPFQVPSVTSGQGCRDFPSCFFSHIPILELTFCPQHSFQSILSPV